MTNIDFVKLMFSNAAPGALPWVTAFVNDPTDDDRGKWAGWPVRRPGSVPGNARRNAYVTLSTYVAADGTYRRRKSHFSAMHCVMVDDVGVKVADRAIALPFTVEVETSPGNRQGWYRIDPPITDRALGERLIERMVAAGLTSDGKDPGMKGVTRYGRLPAGSNNKPKVVAICGGPWRHLLTEYRPTLAYTVEEIAEGFELDLTPPPPRVFTPRSAPPDECASVLGWLQDARLHLEQLGGGWHAIVCPWAHEHSGGVISGTAYSEPGPDNNFAGGFKCHHGHCEDRNIDDLLAYRKRAAKLLRKAIREHACSVI